MGSLAKQTSHPHGGNKRQGREGRQWKSTPPFNPTVIEFAHKHEPSGALIARLFFFTAIKKRATRSILLNVLERSGYR